MTKKNDIENLKDFLDEKADFYNNKDFIEQDPIQIPHRFSLKQDIEIAGFLTATISWGNRKSIINNAEKMLRIMDGAPYDFIKSFSEKDLQKISESAIHRTFSGEDFKYFLRQLQKLYRKSDSLEDFFIIIGGEENFYHALERFRSAFFSDETMMHRSTKHISSPYKNSAAKRLMMYLRWMVRKDKKGVDFGIWQKLPEKYLSVPLDVHSGNISRKLSLLERKQNDWKAVEELDLALRKLDADDPAKYDFALFGLGVSGDF